MKSNSRSIKSLSTKYSGLKLKRKISIKKIKIKQIIIKKNIIIVHILARTIHTPTTLIFKLYFIFIKDQITSKLI
jgi:hypothetical protein